MARPAPLPAPALPPGFDRRAAVTLAEDLASTYPDRRPGSPGASGAARWVADRLAAYELAVERDAFAAEIAGLGRVDLVNLVAIAPARAAGAGAIAVVAHRDDAGFGPGANDNASGTAALIELARAYARPAAGEPVQPAHTLLFLSSDGGAFGAVGAARFLATSPYRDRLLGVIVLDSIAGAAPPRVEIAADDPESPSWTFVETAAARIEEQTGAPPLRSSALSQLIDLAAPFSLYEQAPFVAAGVPAVTVTTLGARPPSGAGDAPGDLNGARLAQIGRATQLLLGSLDQGAELAAGTSSYVYLGSRVVRGWAIQLSLVAALVPYLIAVVDLYARCRRRRVSLGLAFRAYRRRLAFWLSLAVLFELFALLGAWPRGEPRPLNPSTAAAGEWPILALLALGLIGALGWLLAREPLLPRRRSSPPEELAGHAAALLALGVLALLVVATNPFALVFLLPSLHCWLWLPHVREHAGPVRLAVLAGGFAGPLVVLGSFAVRFDLGFDAPWYLASLRSVGYLPLPALVFALAWAAAAAQLAALAVGRYAPYPGLAERPPRGPARELVRRVILTILRLRDRRRRSRSERRALQA